MVIRLSWVGWLRVRLGRLLGVVVCSHYAARMILLRLLPADVVIVVLLLSAGKNKGLRLMLNVLVRESGS